MVTKEFLRVFLWTHGLLYICHVSLHCLVLKWSHLKPVQAPSNWLLCLFFFFLMWKDSKDLNEWREKPCSRIGRPSSVKCVIFSKYIYRFNAILIKITTSFLVELIKFIQKFVWRCKGQTNMLKKNKGGGLQPPDSKTCSKVVVIRQHVMMHDRQIDHGPKCRL